MTERDVRANVTVLRELAARTIPRELEKERAAMDAALALLTGLLLDVARVADALETLARTETQRLVNERLPR
jgi:hypothetical protein